MSASRRIEVMILVKAAPVLTEALQESMCVAAMSLTGEPQWVRLHPVPFRDLEDESKFRKYQEISVDVVRPTSDRRPESWRPVVGSITPGDVITTERAWSTRRERVARLGQPRSMCELVSSIGRALVPTPRRWRLSRPVNRQNYSSQRGTANSSRSGKTAPRRSAGSSRCLRTPASRGLPSKSSRGDSAIDTSAWRSTVGGTRRRSWIGRRSRSGETFDGPRIGGARSAASSRMSCGPRTATRFCSWATWSNTPGASWSLECSGRPCAPCNRLCSGSNPDRCVRSREGPGITTGPTDESLDGAVDSRLPGAGTSESHRSRHFPGRRRNLGEPGDLRCLRRRAPWSEIAGSRNLRDRVGRGLPQEEPNSTPIGGRGRDQGRHPLVGLSRLVGRRHRSDGHGPGSASRDAKEGQLGLMSAGREGSGEGCWAWRAHRCMTSS